MTRPAPRLPLLVLASLALLAACVSSPETRQASAQYSAALAAWSQDLAAFERAWVAEIDALIADLEQALAARAVAERIRKLSADYDGFSNVDWQRQVSRNGLITISAAVYDERDRVHNFVTWLRNVELPASDDPVQVIDGVLATRRSETAAALRAAETLDGFDAEELARLRAEAAQGPFGNDTVANAIVEILVAARMSRDAVPADLDNLEAVMSALATAHASVDRWIQTDVTVPGEDIAALASAWSATLGGAE